MLSTWVGSRLPQKYRKYLKLPDRQTSIKLATPADAAIGKITAEWLVHNRGPCGVYRLFRGTDALNLRLGLIDHAASSVDIQSYLVRDDLSGNLIALALINAASRGVRVRLLMDDAFTQPVDPGLLALSQHVNIEVRVFNPFPRHRSRFVSFMANFNILNRRMHNKSFTVDNAITIVGGRNLADEYFQSSADSEFIDEDVVAIGPVVEDVSDGFDEYWNTPEATPIEELGELTTTPTMTELVDAGTTFVSEQADSLFYLKLSGELPEKLMRGELEFESAHAKLVLDHPDKVRGLVRNQVGETTQYLARVVSAAEREVFVVSPYFVPLAQGVDLFSSLVRKGVRVIIITNSLASTNHPSVHAVYARYRKRLLRQGIELYELRPAVDLDADDDARERGTLTLHSKVAVVDRELTFVGSFNLDPRSLYINTEMGMAVTSRTFAENVAGALESNLERFAYRLRLSRTGGVRWSWMDYDGERMATREPHAGLWRRVRTRLMGLLPIEGQM